MFGRLTPWATGQTIPASCHAALRSPCPQNAPLDLEPDPNSPMSSVAEPVAHALAFQWGELKEEPPAFIDDLLIDLTEALAKAEAAGDEVRAECLDDVLDAFAQGIAKHQRPADQDFDEETLGRAIAQIRACYNLKSGLPRALDQTSNRLGRVW